MRRIGAARGARSGKSGQSKYFAGYKKHSLCALVAVRERFRPVVLCSRARPANVADVWAFKPLLNFVRRRLAPQWPMRFVIGDKGYVQSRYAAFLRKEWEVALVVRAKGDMTAPDDCDERGVPLCPIGERLVWEDYDAPDERLIYRGAVDICPTCPLAGTCPKQFERDAGEHETFFGLVPCGSQLAQRLLRQFRPRIEQGFNTSKNTHRLKGFFLNSRRLAQTLCTISDILDTMNVLAQERPARGRQTRKALDRDIEQPELWD
jgi:extradiol dioxygenase family protein